MLIIAFLMIFLIIRFVVRQEKRRKAEFRERKKRLVTIGSEYDDDDVYDLPELTAHRATPAALNISPTTIRSNTNPYHPPGDD